MVKTVRKTKKAGNNEYSIKLYKPEIKIVKE